MSNYSLIVSIFLIGIAENLSAQVSTCSQTLQITRATYQQGDIHRVPSLLTGCLNKTRGKGRFTRQERLEAYKLLVLSYIYQEETEKADEAMLKLLQKDHFYEITETDPKEFTSLYATYKTWPLFAIGGKVGPNYTYPSIHHILSGSGLIKKEGVYTPGIGIQYGIFVEKALFNKKKTPKWILAPELMVSQYNFQYQNNAMTVDDKTGNSVSSLSAAFTQQKLELNLLMQYQIVKSKFNPYISFGPTLSYLLTSSSIIEVRFDNGSIESGPSVNILSSSNLLEFALTGSIGGKYQFGEVYIVAELRYRYGLTPVSNNTMGLNRETANDYGYIANTITQSSIMANIGFVFPFFNPKKYLK